MKIANANGRPVLILGDEIADIAEASEGRFGPDPMSPVRGIGRISLTSPPPSPPAPARSSRPTCVARCRRPDRCSPSGSTTAATPRSPA